MGAQHTSCSNEINDLTKIMLVLCFSLSEAALPIRDQ